MIESSLALALNGSAPAMSEADTADAPIEETPDTETPAEKPAEPEGYGRPLDQSPKEFLLSLVGNPNIAKMFPSTLRDTLGQLVQREYQIDETSRAEWKEKTEKGMKFALQETQPKNYPWPNASNTIFPLITTAAMQFNARTYPALIQGRNVVKGVVVGNDRGTPATEDGTPDGKPKMHKDGTPIWLSKPGEKRQRATRIGEHMSAQLLDSMEEWEPQTDTMLFQLPIIGGAVRKTYRDHLLKQNRSLIVSLMNLVWNYRAKSFEVAPRHTEILQYYPYEIEEMERAGIFLKLDYGAPEVSPKPEQSQGGDDDAPRWFLEQHRRYDLDEDGYAEPYIVTVHLRSQKVVRIVANFDEKSIEAEPGENEEDDEKIIRVTPVEYYTLIPFLPNPDGGSYPVGFGQLAKPLNEQINTTLNQMFDAGHLANTGSGFISDQLNIHSGEVQFRVGKFIRVGSRGQSIRDSVYQFQWPGPSTVLFQLLGLLMTAGKEMVSIQEILAGDAGIANAPPTTILALIEQGLKIYTAIHKRVYRAFKSEFGKLYRLNRLYIKEAEQYEYGDERREITPDDYRLGGGVVPIADPTMLTDLQKLGRSQILLEFKDDPLVNKQEVLTRVFSAAQMDRIEDLWAPPNPVQAQIAQLMVQEKQGEISRTQAADMKDRTQAFLNLALARSKASGPEVEWINAQLELLRMHIEAVNTMVRAAEVHRKHGADMSEATQRARENAATDITQGLPGLQPSGPAIPGNEGSGIQPMAPPPGNGGVPAVPAGPGGLNPPSGAGYLGSGQTD